MMKKAEREGVLICDRMHRAQVVFEDSASIKEGLIMFLANPPDDIPHEKEFYQACVNYLHACLKEQEAWEKAVESGKRKV
jgi:hypothetical protein